MNKSKDNSDKPKVKYHSFDTFPARVFFEVRESGNYQLMRPKPGVSAKVLEKMFSGVYDEYFVKCNNTDAERYLELRGLIAVLNCKKISIEGMMRFLWQIPANLWDVPEIVEMRNAQIEAINKYMDTPISIEEDLIDEIHRVLNVEIGIIKDELYILEAEMSDLTKETDAVMADYYDRVAAMSDVHGRTLDEQMMLPMYVALEKSAIKKSVASKMAALKRK